MKRLLWWACFAALEVSRLVAAGEPSLRATLDFDARVYSVAFSPDGRTLASVGGDDRIGLWDVSTGKCIATLRPKESEIAAFRLAVFSPTGSALATVGYCPGTIKIWDVASRRNTVTIEGASPKTSIAFDPGSGLLASTDSFGGIVRLWDTATGNNVRRFGGEAWFPVAFSSDGKKLASGGDGKTIKLWDVATGKPIAVFQINCDAGSVAFSPDGKTLAAAGYNTVSTGSAREAKYVEEIVLWNLTNGVRACTFKGSAMAFAPDGRTLASGSHDGTVSFWEVPRGENIVTFVAHPRPVNSLAFSPDGGTLVSGSRDGTIKLWHVEPTPKK